MEKKPYKNWTKAKKRKWKRRQIKASKVGFGDRDRDTKKKGKRKIARGREVAISSTEATQELIYGEFPVGGVISYLARQEGPGDLHAVVTLAGHEIDSVRILYVDGRLVYFDSFHPTFGLNTAIEKEPRSGIVETSLGGLIELYTQSTGADDQVANSTLVAASATFQRPWTANHRQLGCAYAYLKIHANQNKWESFPDLSFLVRGKLVYDPRTATTAWSRNAALVIADYLTDEKFGLGVDSNLIYWGSSENDIGSVWYAAQKCDETIKALGGDQPRYAIDTVIDTTMTASTVLEEMAETISGRIVFFEGKWRILPGVWVAPVLELTEEDLRGPIEIQTNIGKRDRINAVKGKFMNAYNLYDPSDFPPITNALYEDQDGGILWDDLTLNMTIEPNQAQRIAKIRLEKNRQSISVSAEFGLRALQLTIGDNLELTLPNYGWSQKTFEVKDFALNYSEDEGLSVQLSLHETASGIFDWNDGFETALDLAPNSNLPSAFFVEPPSITSLASGTDQLLLRGDGAVVSRLKVSFTVAQDVTGYTEIRYSLAGQNDWNYTGRISTDVTFHYLTDVVDLQTYDVQVRSANALGIVSEWSSVASHLVLGKTEPPSNVDGFQGRVTDFGAFLQWSAIPDVDLAHYEIRRFNDQYAYNGGDETDWTNSIVVDEISGTSIAIELLSEGSHKYSIKAVDSSGNYSTDSVWFDFAVLGPRAPAVSFVFVGPDYKLSWVEPHKTFSIAHYEIRYGDTFEGSTYVATTSALEFRARVDWLGGRIFWVVAHDIAGNQGQEGAVAVAVLAPGAVRSLKSDVVENNIWISWLAPQGGSLPIQEYYIYRNPDSNDFGSATYVNKVAGTFYPSIEFSAGVYFFWIRAVDTAGNEGPVVSTNASVTTPPDFRLDVDEVFNEGDMINQGGSIFSGYYGSKFGGHGLVSETLDDTVWALRFKLAKNANLLQALFYWQNNNGTGKSGGNGGTYRVSVYNDDGSNDHYPLFGGSIASTTVSFGLSGSGPESDKYWLPANFGFGSSSVSSGAEFSGDGIANTATSIWYNNQGYPRLISIRFKAEVSGKLHDIMGYWKNNNSSTYSKGTGGTYDFHLMADDGAADGAPTGSPIATANIAFNITDQNSDIGETWRVITFGTPPTITEGTIYHLVMENVHADPANNFIAINSIYGDSGELPSGQGIEQFTAFNKTTAEWTVCYTDANETTIATGNWQERPGHRPCMVLTVDTDDDGIPDEAFGNGWIHCMSADIGLSGGFQLRIGGNNRFRQPLVPEANKTLTAVNIVMARYTGGTNGTGDLTVEIQDATRTALETVTVASGSFNGTTRTDGKQTAWVRVPLSGSTTLMSGQTYYMELRAPSGTEYLVNAVRSGYAQGDPQYPSYGRYRWTQGFMQVSENGGASWGSPLVWGSPSATLVMQHQFEQSVAVESSEVSLTADTIYHLVIENISSVPSTDFVSISHLYADATKMGLNPPATADEYISPVLTTEEWNYNQSVAGVTSMQSSGMNWSSTDGRIPVGALILDTDDDGIGDCSHGASYVNIITSDVGESRGYQKYITDTDYLRQSFVPAENITISTLKILVARKSGTADLTCELQDSLGAVVSTGTIADTDVYETTEEGGENATWASCVMSNNPTLLKDSTYYLILKAAGASTTYMVNGLRDGYKANFGTFVNYPDAGFSSGNVMWSADSGSTWTLPTFWGELQDDLQFCFHFTKEQITDPSIAWLDEVSFIPGSATLSWEDWFDNKGHTSLQDQIDDGHTIFIEPMLATGQVLFFHDMGEILTANTAIRVDFSKTQLKGTTTETVTIYTSNDNVTYTQHTFNAQQISASNFRYIRVLMDFVNANDASVATYQDVRLRVFAKQVEYTTLVEFPDDYDTITLTFPEDKDFVSITGVSDSIKGSEIYSSTGPAFFRWDVPPGSRPGYMQMWLFDENGNKVGGVVSVTIKGIL